MFGAMRLDSGLLILYPQFPHGAELPPVPRPPGIGPVFLPSLVLKSRDLIVSGATFQFGENWKRFLQTIDEERIRNAENSIKEMLGREDLAGLTFLDVGCGSGLFSLGAQRLGAARVFSVDADPQSVECAAQLRRQHAPDAAGWEVQKGSILDLDLPARWGRWDVVYSWGVLHHTGNMVLALRNVGTLVADGGTLFISIYNDQGWKSSFWKIVKRAYNASVVLRVMIVAVFMPLFAAGHVGKAILGGGNPFGLFGRYKARRGMSFTHDVIDWLGGLPFEVAAPQSIIAMFRDLGFEVVRMKTVQGRSGCNEYVFSRPSPKAPSSMRI